MSKVLLIVTSLLCWNSSVFAQFFNDGDALSTGLSGADAAYTGTVFYCQNPALFAETRQSQLGISYYNPYLLPELSTSSIAGVFRTEAGSIGTTLSYFGTSLYNKSKLSLGYGQQLFKNISAGINIRYQHSRVEALNTSAYVVTGDLGILTKFSDELSLGLVYSNISYSGNNNEWEIPDVIKMGIAYSEDKNYYCTLQLAVIDYSQVLVSAAFEYWLKRIFVFRSGVSIENDTSYSFGCGIFFQDLNLNLGFRQHAFLGLSSGITLIYLIKTNEKE